ncbi:MAG: DUF86 domain-containing protein [Bacteroides sp.]|nr:DUF86 domain-containing protein [Bacteroides sp.]
MREKPRDKERLEHILTACNTITAGMQQYSFDDIQKDTLLFYGFIKQVEIIGEAAYQTTRQFKAEHPDIPWDKMEGMRHVLVHDYYSINFEQLKYTIEYNIPDLFSKIQALYTAEFGE